MPLSFKEQQILEHIHRYCHEVKLALETFGYSKDEFAHNPVFLNSVSMPIAQIGELAKKFDDKFVRTYNHVPWKAIKGMRDIFVHDYHSMSKDFIWETAVRDIPDLSQQCETILMANDVSIP